MQLASSTFAVGCRKWVDSLTLVHALWLAAQHFPYSDLILERCRVALFLLRAASLRPSSDHCWPRNQGRLQAAVGPAVDQREPWTTRWRDRPACSLPVAAVRTLVLVALFAGCC